MSLYENGPTSFADASFSYYTGGNPSFNGVSNTELNNRKIYQSYQESQANLSKRRQITGIVTVPVGLDISNGYFLPVIVDTGNTDSLVLQSQATIPEFSLIKNVEYSYIPYNSSGDVTTVRSCLSVTSSSFSKSYNGTINPIQLPSSYTYTLLNQPSNPAYLTVSTAVTGNVKFSGSSVPVTGTAVSDGRYLWLVVSGGRTNTVETQIRITINYTSSQDLNN